MKSVGEAQITPQMMAQVTPDVVSPQGKQELFSHLAKAMTEKPMLDSVLGDVTKQHQGDFTSRIKNPETVVQKIAQKRLQGRDYNTGDVNDAYGGRIIVADKKDIPDVVATLQKKAADGAFDILKKENVTKDTYHAMHLDIMTPQGARGEVQVMTPQEALESVANHSLRSVFGEKPAGSVKELRERQAVFVKKLPNTTAMQKTRAIQTIAKANGDKPLDPRLIAQVLQS